jgi:hypothetical protein
VVITVPASFDEVARELTVEAAKQAGLPKVTLLEEPQAALYAWLETRGEAWRKELKVGDVILVVDVGGGTSDFSLMAVLEEQGNLQLHRVAVGEHLLLGGDNMDLALAHTLKAKIESDPKQKGNSSSSSTRRGRPRRRCLPTRSRSRTPSPSRAAGQAWSRGPSAPSSCRPSWWRCWWTASSPRSRRARGLQPASAWA